MVKCGRRLWGAGWGGGGGREEATQNVLKLQRVWQTGTDNFEIQRCVLNRWVLRACLSEVLITKS